MTRAIIGVVIIAIAGSVAFWYFSDRDAVEVHPSVVELPEPTPEVVTPQASFPIEDIKTTSIPAPEPIPALHESDEAIVEALATLIGPESIGSHFVLEQVVSRIVTTVDNLDARQLAPLVMPVKSPEGNFQVDGEELLVIDPSNKERYAPYMNIISAIEFSQAIEMYVKYYPLFQEAYAELGHEDVYFNDRLVEIVDHLLNTPIPSEDPLLVKSEAVYIFADEELEALSAGQKIIIRTGSANAELLLEKLREFRLLLASEDI